MERIKKVLSMLVAISILISNCPVSGYATSVEPISSEVLMDGNADVLNNTFGAFSNDVDMSTHETQCTIETSTYISEDAIEDNRNINDIDDVSSPIDPEYEENVGIPTVEIDIEVSDKMQTALYTSLESAQVSKVYNGNRYELYDLSMTWTDAKEFCKEKGGHLVTITSAEEQAFIESILPDPCTKNQYWIGMSYVDGAYSWVTGEELQYTNWGEGQPDRYVHSGISEAYVQILNAKNVNVDTGVCRYSWNDMLNDNRCPGQLDFLNESTVGFICEFENNNEENSITSSFEYVILNGTYCQITGYTGTATAIRIPSEMDGYIVQSIAGSAFYGNTTLTTVVFPETIETMGNNVFSGCTSLTDVRLNNGLRNLGAYTFSSCTALQSITLPDTIFDIDSYAFQGCTGLCTVNLPATLTTISQYAFSGCTALTRVMLPDSVATIGYRAFENCSKLSEINYPQSWSSATICEGYEYSSPSTNYRGLIFSGCSSLKKIEIPEGVTEIPAYAFNGCTNLEEVILPSTLTTIGDYAFYGCTGLTAVIFNEGLTSIGSYSFSGCSAITEITLPSTLTTLSECAFQKCTGLRSMMIAEGLTKISANAFSGCTGLTAVNLPATLTTISQYAFSGCTALTRVMLPDSVATIGYRAFENCSRLSEINYPQSWSSATVCEGYEYSSPSTNYRGLIFSGCS